VDYQYTFYLGQMQEELIKTAMPFRCLSIFPLMKQLPKGFL